MARISRQDSSSGLSAEEGPSWSLTQACTNDFERRMPKLRECFREVLTTETLSTDPLHSDTRMYDREEEAQVIIHANTGK